MPLRHLGYVELPPHTKSGGFDHAAIHRGTTRVYVAHPANDAVDVIDGSTQCYIESVRGLDGVAGALVSDEHEVVFTSNRSENTIGMFPTADHRRVTKVGVGLRPNGLAYDPRHRRLLAANVGDPAIRDSFTVSIVDTQTATRVAEIPVAGRTRWTVFDPAAEVFHVNIADPPQIVVIDAEKPSASHRVANIPSRGPHGLDLDPETRRLFCACDGGRLLAVHADSGDLLHQCDIGGVPDVVFLNAALQHLYVAIGDPGVIEVFDTRAMRRCEKATTEKGAHTLAFDPASNTVYAFLPETHRAAVYADSD